MKINAETEKKIELLVNQMTLEEKVSLCHANSKFTVAGIERFGIEELSMSDGPHGVRSELERDSWASLNRPEDKCTYLPTGTALAATWNPTLGRLFGETLGSEARYRKKDIILGPGVNIIRTPLCGRNFEYLSEDPCLIEKMAPQTVQGIESQDVAACVKHYALNNQELDRGKVNVEVSLRALNEIYLKGFKAAIIDGGACAVMGAYNRYLGEHCCHNDYLVNKVLKEKWGFKGVFLSDWAGVHDTEQAINNGLDIEMGTPKPYNEYYLADAFLEKAKQSEEVRRLLDDKVKRILRLISSVNKLSPDRNKGEFNTKKHQDAAYTIASEAMVLLKNENNVLPINKKRLKKLLVLGPNATSKHSPGGCSSGINAYYEITPLDGIKNRLGDICEIEYDRCANGLQYKPIPIQYMNIADLKAGCRGCCVTAFKDNCSRSYVSDTVSVKDGDADYYDISVSLDIPESGTYSFKFSTTGSVTATINDGERISIPFESMKSISTTDFSYVCEKEQKFEIKARVVKGKTRNVDFTIDWLTPEDCANTSSENSILEKAAKADYVIYCSGLDHSFDTESWDKRSMKLPAEQDVIIPKLLDANPNTIIALTAGSPISMPWIDKANAVLWCWYAGMESGNVLCDIITGNICPSGKMPFTLPKEYADTPVARYGEYKAENCKYNEDILVGYRAYEYDGIKPLFPFGHGLSYSTFEYSDLSVKTGKDCATVTFTVKNIGNVKAKEVAQVYIGDPVCSVLRPKKELRNFEKIELEPNQSQTVSLNITSTDLSFFDEATDNWKLESGEFTAYIGSSSEDIRLKQKFEIK